MLRPQDVLVVLKIHVRGFKQTYESLGIELDLSPSQAHVAVKRARKSGLLNADGLVQNRALADVMILGVKYFFPAELGPIKRGMPTAHAAPPLSSLFKGSDEPPPVWPDPKGSVRGQSLEPIYKTVPNASRRDSELYEYLALMDAIRIGRAREAKMAREEICSRLGVDL